MRSAVEAAVQSATGQDTPPTLRTPFQFARAAAMIHCLVVQRDACSTLGVAHVFPAPLIQRLPGRFWRISNFSMEHRLSARVCTATKRQQGNMRIAIIRVSDAKLSYRLAGMREWLDRHHYEPVRFVYDHAENALVISVEFPNEWQAKAFATRFDGKVPAAAHQLS